MAEHSGDKPERLLKYVADAFAATPDQASPDRFEAFREIKALLTPSAVSFGEPVRDEVSRFSVLMERELKANDHKGGWKGCSSGYLLKRLRDELVELERAVLASTENQARIASETADVANFAMMIADIYRALPTGRIQSHAPDTSLPASVMQAVKRVSDKVMDASLTEADLVELCRIARAS